MSEYVTGPIEGILLSPVESPDGSRTYVLLPTLSELLGVPAFGLSAPILLPGNKRPMSGWDLFGARDQTATLH